MTKKSSIFDTIRDINFPKRFQSAVDRMEETHFGLCESYEVAESKRDIEYAIRVHGKDMIHAGAIVRTLTDFVNLYQKEVAADDTATMCDAMIRAFVELIDATRDTSMDATSLMRTAYISDITGKIGRGIRFSSALSATVR